MFWEKKINSFFTELTGSTSSEQNWVNKFERMLKDIMISTWRVFVVLYTCKRVGGPFPLMGCWSKRDACEFCIIARFFHHLKSIFYFMDLYCHSKRDKRQRSKLWIFYGKIPRISSKPKKYGDDSICVCVFFFIDFQTNNKINNYIHEHRKKQHVSWISCHISFECCAQAIFIFRSIEFRGCHWIESYRSGELLLFFSLSAARK